jgi:hypothetical protein
LPADVAAVYDMGLQGYLAQMEIDNEGNVKGMWG